MNVVSLGYRTDIELRRLAGAVVEDRGDHLVIRTAANPGFYWGNFILVGEGPAARDATRWLAAFSDAFPGAGHVAIGLDGREPDPDAVLAYTAAGLTSDVSTVLTAGQVRAPARATDAVLRTFDRASDWTQLVGLRHATDDGDEPDDEAHRLFTERRVAGERQLCADGAGVWFGAFVGDRLVSALGMVVADGLGRYQSVETHPDFRRRGLAGWLVHTAGRHALDERGAQTLVIVADPDYTAIRLYRALGFTDSEREVQLQRTRLQTAVEPPR